LHKLEELTLYDTPIEDLEPISQLKLVKDASRLNLGDMRVRSLVPLRFARQLKKLFLFNTPVKDLAPLRELRSLEFLDLRNTAVGEGQIAMLKSSLPNLEIAWSAASQGDAV
jgi:Leucine-rich repeat (LRR) protein